MIEREVDIFLVEDRREDAELLIEALKDLGILHRLEHAANGEEALHKLRTREVRPDLVLLDLNLPSISGLEVLTAIKKDPRLRMIPVIILTNSQSQEDVTRCYAAHANAYIRKPLGFDVLVAAVQATGQFWFRTVSLPVTFQQSPASLPPPPPKRKKTKKT